MTERLFLDDAALRACEARVVAVLPGGVVLDRTVFYARSGGQPGDLGVLRWNGGGSAAVGEAVKGEGEAILHPLDADAAPPPIGAIVRAEIDGIRRDRHRRMHTLLHLLCSLLPGAGVTGGQIGADRSRLDFDLPDPPPKEVLEAGLQALVDADHPVGAEWIDAEALDRDPGLVRTLSVQPPRTGGRVRLVRIGAAARPIDLQPCGGTHVARTGAIGRVRVAKLESKGRQNRRVTVTLEE